MSYDRINYFILMYKVQYNNCVDLFGYRYIIKYSLNTNVKSVVKKKVTIFYLG